MLGRLIVAAAILALLYFLYKVQCPLDKRTPLFSSKLLIFIEFFKEIFLYTQNKKCSANHELCIAILNVGITLKQKLVKVPFFKSE